MGVPAFVVNASAPGFDVEPVWLANHVCVTIMRVSDRCPRRCGGRYQARFSGTSPGPCSSRYATSSRYALYRWTTTLMFVCDTP